jgi:hypothetical protein
MAPMRMRCTVKTSRASKGNASHGDRMHAYPTYRTKYINSAQMNTL